MQNKNFAYSSAQTPHAPEHTNNKLLDFWYRLAAVPEDPNASYREQELGRRMRTTSIALLTITIIFILFLPGCLVYPNKFVMYPETSVFFFCALALFLNKKGHPILAGAIVTVHFEFAVMFVCLTSRPFDTSDLPLYQLFVLGEVMALTLVSPRGMGIIAACNVAFIILHLCFLPYLPHTQHLAHALQVQFAAILIMPVSLQIMVAAVVGWYANNQRQTIQKANRAEMNAKLERQRSEQSKKVEEEKIALQKSIEQIVAAHARSLPFVVMAADKYL